MRQKPQRRGRSRGKKVVILKKAGSIRGGKVSKDQDSFVWRTTHAPPKDKKANGG